MKKRRFLLMLVIIVLLLSFIYMNKFNQKMELLENEVMELRKEQNNHLENNEKISIHYIDLKEKRRLVSETIPLLLTPEADGQIINTIEENTIVEVHDFVEVNEEIWMYVTKPTLDEKTNLKGWIKEIDTQIYTVDSQKYVKSPITIKAGTEGYKIDFLNEANDSTPIIISTDHICTITDEQEGYVALSCRGSEHFIVKKADILYPPINE